MEFFSAYILIFLTIMLALYIFVQGARGTVEILSTRNMFLLGLIIFQMTGPATSILSGMLAEYQPAELSKTSVIYTSMLTVFLGLFLVIYQGSGKFIDKLLSKRQQVRTNYSAIGLMLIAAATIPIGILCQFGLVYIPVLGPGFHVLGFGIYAIGAGLASWVWFKRFYNPVFFTMAVAIILVAMGLTFYQNFGRRPLLGIVAIIGWAAYYSHWRSLGFRSVMMRGALVAGGGFFLLAIFTSVREGDFMKRSAFENISSLKGGTFSTGAISLLAGQEAGMNSMWIIESRPDSKDYDTLHSLRSVITYPIPRSIWPEKPIGLSIQIPQQEQKIRNVSRHINIGPGIIGHIENDNPFIALWLYPFILAFYFRFLDRVVIWNPDNPFLVLPMGAALGQFIAIPRGELGAFFFAGTLNVVGSLVIMLVISYILKTFGIISKSTDDEYYETDEYQDQYSDSDSYSDEHEDAYSEGAW